MRRRRRAGGAAWLKGGSIGWYAPHSCPWVKGSISYTWQHLVLRDHPSLPGGSGLSTLTRGQGKNMSLEHVKQLSPFNSHLKRTPSTKKKKKIGSFFFGGEFFFFF
uniref:Uncharacterized protein n=1 Tax=Opuntia streptacantha TaxID=393608 RepID=A0A7C9A169_OPUST